MFTSGKPAAKAAALIALAMACMAPRAWALVNLEFRPAHQTVLVGDPLLIGMYLVSDSDSVQSVASLGVILEFDPTYLALNDEVINNGPYPWLASGFPEDSGLDGLNNTFGDGDALYNAFGQLRPAPPLFVPPDGVLVTTFVFTALAETPLTTVRSPRTSGDFTLTQILDGDVPGVDVTGTLGTATVTILPEPASLLLMGLGVCVVARRRRCNR